MDKLKKYILLLLYLIPTITYVKGDGQMAILEKPSSMKLHGGDQMSSSELLDTLEHLLGYQFEGAKQMEMMNVFDYAELKVILMNVNENIINNESIHPIKKYQLKEDMTMDNMIGELKKTVAEKNFFGTKAHVGTLDPEQFASEIDLKDDGPKVIWADLKSIADDAAMKTMTDLPKATESSDTVLKIIMFSDGKMAQPFDREKRDTPAVPEESNDQKKKVVNAESLNLADDYDENFPVIFNIMLWFSIALIFALISICMVIANMDPGRDSIIYRMTSTRMKKDN